MDRYWREGLFVNKIRVAALAGVGMLGASVFAGAGTAGPEFKNKYESISATQFCGAEADADTITYNGPLKMWPPNHKMQDVSATITDGDGTGTVTLTITPAVDDTAGGDGGPNHDPDYTPEEIAATGNGTATVDFQLRSERSGKGEGRTYTLNWVAKFDDKECSSGTGGNTPFVVFVPHDMRGGADWK